MSVLTASRSFSSRDIYTFLGETITATSKLISLVDSYNNLRVDYGGTFKYSNEYLSSGTLKSANVFVDSIKYYSITGSYDALTYAYYGAGDTDDFLAYIFGGNDTFNGSNEDDYINFYGAAGAGNDKYFGTSNSQKKKP